MERSDCAFACAVCRILCFMCWRKLCPCCCRPPERRPEYSFLCVGLEGAGKSTLLAAAAGEDTNNTEQTKGFAIKAVQRPDAILNIKELGGNQKIRPHWNKYYSGHQALVYVIDSTDSTDKIRESCLQLQSSLNDPNLSTVPVLIACNKQDVAGARTQKEITEAFQLDTILVNKVHFIIECSNKDPEPFKRGLDDLIHHLSIPLQQL